MARSRYRPTPAQSGWVVTRDMTRELVDSIDCSHGGAQQAFERKCAELAGQGWSIGRRFADNVFADRPPERVQVTIEAFDPSLPAPRAQRSPP